MGYAVSASSGAVIRSVAGQSFVGRTMEGSNLIESGLLADTILRGTILDVEEAPMLPMEYRLEQNYPNPFNPSTIIKYQIPNTNVGFGNRDLSSVSLKVYDVLGREVVALGNGAEQAGEHAVVWNAADQPGGIYFCRLQTTHRTQTIKLLLIK
jgi:hypothetical protein